MMTGERAQDDDGIAGATGEDGDDDGDDVER